MSKASLLTGSVKDIRYFSLHCITSKYGTYSQKVTIILKYCFFADDTCLVKYKSRNVNGRLILIIFSLILYTLFKEIFII